MAYDGATSTAVLYGCLLLRGVVTWTWDGSTWTRQHPAISPTPGRCGASMAYDATTGNIVLFGGEGNSGSFLFRDTWTWG